MCITTPLEAKVEDATNKGHCNLTHNWKGGNLAEPSLSQKFARMVAHSKNEIDEAHNVENLWNAMKEMWLKAAD